VLGIPVVAGRDFLPTDAGTTAIVVNQSFAREHFGSPAAAIGRSVQWGTKEWAPGEIVGVVGDTRHRGLKFEMRSMFYRPLVQEWSNTGLPITVRLMTREEGDSARASDALRRAVQAADPRIPVRVTQLAERYREQTAEERLLALSLAVLAGSTLLLSMLGIVSLVGQLVADRMRELAIRLVLGSSPGATLWLTMRAVVRPAVAGVAAGLVLAWWAVELIRQFLFEMSPYDARLWLSAVAVLMLAALAGAWWPARRALRLEPAHVLRSE
jgi:predicted lysophospholipase L1 biosynthesis ABC-type transport system permease subunit